MGSGVNTNLFVAQLDHRIDEVFLKQEFEKYGEVLNAYVIKNEAGFSKCYGFVHFSSTKSCHRAMVEMNGKFLLSRNIRVFTASEKYVLPKGRNNTTVWASQWGIPPPPSSPTECNTPSHNVSEISYSEDQPSNAKVSYVKMRLCKLLEEQLYTDVTFYPENERKSSISAHRAILAVGSPQFAKMLLDDHKGKKQEVQISNLAFDAFSNIVKYLYTDDIFFESDSQVQDILVGAKQFQIESLVDRCNSYFETQELTAQNVFSKLQMSISNEIDVLKNRCMNYIEKNTFKAINSSDFLKCSHDTVSAICKLQSFNLKSEVQLMDRIMKWLYDQPPRNRQKLIEPLLKCIRFLNFTVVELGEVLKKYPDLLTPADALQILVYLSNPPDTPDSKSLPSWCNKDPTSRCTFVKNQCKKIGIPINDQPAGRVIFPLKSSSEQQNVTILTSLLQMTCIIGCHQISAIKLSFQRPVSDKSIIKSLSINVHVVPCGFRMLETLEVANTLEVRVPFRRMIRARPGDLVEIAVEARNIQSYKFLQFDDTLSGLINPHFQCWVSSRPKTGKLYLISEVEYDPPIY